LSSSTAGVRADVIVVAAGGSSRMGGRDKLAVEIGGRPLLAWTLDALTAAPEVARVVVVTSSERRAAVAAAPWLPPAVIEVVVGGARRQESVRAGFAAFDRAAPDEMGVVLVHDAARPLVEPALVGAVVAATAGHGAAIPIVPVAETLKRIDGALVGATVDRSDLGAAQTPQGVRRDLLREAYRRFPAEGLQTFTDEAALLEACSIEVHVVPGDPGNLKVTLPGDLGRAAVALTGRATSRTGIGHDSHPFGPGLPLRLGGIEIAGAPRLAGHSDGDVLLHALADALLGAAGQGDLGRLFPADARTPEGIASTDLIAEVRRRLDAAGWRPATVDATVVAARPRLGSHLDAMRAAIAALLGVEPSAVNVKASSGNLDGAEGAGRSVSALVIASVEASR
jgi:2-C-methyl-D-erythritol 4-phosphate cytidylyltransferase / 2-C-methyl-D-erythritol 2,4-cyclodiphosphate synthase